MTQYYNCKFKTKTEVTTERFFGYFRNSKSLIQKSKQDIIAHGILIQDDNTINGYDKEYLEFYKINPDTIQLINEPDNIHIITDDLDYDNLDWDIVDIKPATKADLILARSGGIMYNNNDMCLFGWFWLPPEEQDEHPDNEEYW